MGTEETGHHIDTTGLAQAARRAQHLEFRIAIESVAGFDLDGGYALGGERGQPATRRFHQQIFAGGTGGRYRRNDAASLAGDLLVADTGQTLLEFPGTIAAVYEMGVAVDETRRHPAPPGRTHDHAGRDISGQ